MKKILLIAFSAIIAASMVLAIAKPRLVTTQPLPALSALSDPAFHVRADFDYYDLKHAIGLGAIRGANEFSLVLASHIDPGRMDLITDPIQIGGATLTHQSFLGTEVFKFSRIGNIWIARCDNAYFATGTTASLTLRIWERGADYADPDAAAVEEVVQLVTFNL